VFAAEVATAAIPAADPLNVLGFVKKAGAAAEVIMGTSVVEIEAKVKETAISTVEVLIAEAEGAAGTLGAAVIVLLQVVRVTSRVVETIPVTTSALVSRGARGIARVVIKKMLELMRCRWKMAI
jgi:hypothetical protein